MARGETNGCTWVLLLRGSEACAYESSAGTVRAIELLDRRSRCCIADWLERARANGRYDQLKLIGEPAQVMELIFWLPAATRALLTDIRSEDLSQPDACPEPTAARHSGVVRITPEPRAPAICAKS